MSPLSRRARTTAGPSAACGVGAPGLGAFSASTSLWPCASEPAGSTMVPGGKSADVGIRHWRMQCPTIFSLAAGIWVVNRLKLAVIRVFTNAMQAGSLDVQCDGQNIALWRQMTADDDRNLLYLRDIFVFRGAFQVQNFSERSSQMNLDNNLPLAVLENVIPRPYN